MRFSRQEYWSGLPFPFPGELPDPEIEPRSPTLWADALPAELCRKPMSRTEFQSYLMQVKHMDSEAKSTDLEKHLFINKIVLIILMDLDNYFQFNILFMSGTKVLTFVRKLSGKRKSMGVELKHHNIL